MNVAIKRIYQKPDTEDGLRILVDRLWPRGLSKSDAQVDVWLKAAAPSHGLRKWYHHELEKWPEFKQRYFAELDGHKEAVDELLEHVKYGKVTLLYAAKALEYNHAVALLEYIGMVSR
jgi:uncharacterized protein YeaO (DUF488 family)